jgi:hypothetical protein
MFPSVNRSPSPPSNGPSFDADKQSPQEEEKVSSVFNNTKENLEVLADFSAALTFPEEEEAAGLLFAFRQKKLESDVGQYAFSLPRERNKRPDSKEMFPYPISIPLPPCPDCKTNGSVKLGGGGPISCEEGKILNSHGFYSSSSQVFRRQRFKCQKKNHILAKGNKGKKQFLSNNIVLFKDGIAHRVIRIHAPNNSIEIIEPLPPPAEAK